MSSAHDEEDGAPIVPHLQHLHVFVEFDSGENLQEHIVSTAPMLFVAVTC